MSASRPCAAARATVSNDTPRCAANDSARTEFAGEASVSAYEGLAASRGVSLEVVARAAARGELAAVVRLDPVKPERRRRN